MRRFERPEIKSKYADCIKCGTGTRSHVLEPALYEEYEQEIVVGASDTFSSNQWEEVDTVIKSERVQDSVVMCHKCWTSALEYYNSELPKMTFEGSGRYNRIANVLHNIRYYGLDQHLTNDARESIVKLRASLSKFVSKVGKVGEEE
jgi:hypothetical protein